MERLQKVLAQAGIASRRKCEELIVNGRVTVDGQVCTELGTKVDPGKQVVKVDGIAIETEQKYVVILHKPTSYISSVNDPEGRRTVTELVTDIDARLYPVGRLDYDTSGLLILTNDGELTNRLLHPSRVIDKVYRATVLGMPEKETIRTLRNGVKLEDGVTSPAEVTALRLHPKESVIDLVIHEGKNRQVRRMFDAVGFPVKRLKRVKFGPIEIGNLPPGQWRYPTEEEWNELYRQVGLPVPNYISTTEPNVELPGGHVKRQASHVMRQASHVARAASPATRQSNRSRDTDRQLNGRSQVKTKEVRATYPKQRPPRKTRKGQD